MLCISWLDAFKCYESLENSQPQSIWFFCFVSGSYRSSKNILKTTFKRNRWSFFCLFVCFSRIILRKENFVCVRGWNFDASFAWGFLSRDDVSMVGQQAVLVSESTKPVRQAVQSEVIWLKFICLSGLFPTIFDYLE